MGEDDFVGEEGNPLKGGGAVGPGAADEFVFAVGPARSGADTGLASAGEGWRDIPLLLLRTLLIIVSGSDLFMASLISGPAAVAYHTLLKIFFTAQPVPAYDHPRHPLPRIRPHRFPENCI
jgi:hypothetical protein